MMMLMMMMMLLMMTVTINMYIYICYPPLRYPRFVLESCKIVVVSLQFPIAISILGHL